MKKKMFFATLVAMLAVSFGCSVFAASNRNYSDWFDLDRINAIDVDEDLRDEASREEVALLLAELCDELELLPSSRTLEFDDDDDFSSSSAYKMVTRLSSTGIVAGYPNGDFGPENDITRAEALAMVLRTVDYFCLETDTYRRGSSFTDTKGHWAEVDCERAYEQGLVSGRGNGRFYPDDDITREEIITILVNLMGESNNPLISAIDKIYDLEFDNSYYEEEDDDRYNNRYNDRYDRYYDDEDDYEDLIKRPVVDTGSYNNSSNSSNTGTTSSKKPERPVVDLSGTENKNTNNGDKPSRPVVDTTTSTSVSVERPTVDTTTTGSTSVSVERPVIDVENEQTASSSKPARPVV